MRLFFKWVDRAPESSKPTVPGDKSAKGDQTSRSEIMWSITSPPKPFSAIARVNLDDRGSTRHGPRSEEGTVPITFTPRRRPSFVRLA